MKPPSPRSKCLNCNELFLPDYRSGLRQRFCHQPDCRQASQRQSQRAWLAKSPNQNYFRDAKNAERVRDWQKDHPGYWKNTARYRRRGGWLRRRGSVVRSDARQSPRVSGHTCAGGSGDSGATPGMGSRGRGRAGST